MTRTTAFVMVALCVILCSCRKGKNKMKAFAEKTISYVQNNELDSLKSVFPDMKFESAAFKEDFDEIKIEKPNEFGETRIKFGDAAWIMVEEKEGGYKIIDSYGLGVFPEERLKTAKETGMVGSETTDNHIAELLKDDAFFAWLEKKAVSEMKEGISMSVGSTSYNSREDWDDYDEWTDFYQAIRKVTVTNNTDTPISGSEYSIGYTAKHWTCCEYEQYIPSSRSKSGVDLAPGESKTLTLASDYSEWSLKPLIENVHLNTKISAANAMSSYTPTGTEYQEYLDSKK